MRNNSFSLPASSRSGKVFRNSRYGNTNTRPKRQGAYINPAKFVNKAATPQEQVEFIPVHKFSDFAFTAELKRNITERGYENPTQIQDGAIEPLLEGKDLIGLANTGTGKTAAFILPIIHHLQTAGGQALIMAPTRELAVQIDDEFRAFAKNLRLFSAICVGGANIQRQKAALSRRPQIVIGTPGRLKDLFNQGSLRLERTNILVLDEADRMLDMGFIKDIRFLIEKLPHKRQSMCFSATMSRDIEVLMQELMQEPVTVSVRTSETSEHVEQDVIEAHSKDHKIQILQELLTKPEFDKVLIFGETKFGVQRLADSLAKAGIPAQSIHGNKTQAQRQRSLDAFKSNQVKVLVATDVAARGLDIPKVSHVINFDQPNTYSDYIHRIGRTGRAGQAGKALTFVTPR